MSRSRIEKEARSLRASGVCWGKKYWQARFGPVWSGLVAIGPAPSARGEANVECQRSAVERRVAARNTRACVKCEKGVFEVF